MAVLITTLVKGQNAQGYDEVSQFLHPLVKQAQGLILHSAYAAGEEWWIMEVWNSKAEADKFFSENVAPNLPRGIVPKRSYQELHAVITP